MAARALLWVRLPQHAYIITRPPSSSTAQPCLCVSSHIRHLSICLYVQCLHSPAPNTLLPIRRCRSNLFFPCITTLEFQTPAWIDDSSSPPSNYFPLSHVYQYIGLQLPPYPMIIPLHLRKTADSRLVWRYAGAPARAASTTYGKSLFFKYPHWDRIRVL